MSVSVGVPQMPPVVVLKEVNNVGHLVLLVVTAGLWFPFYIFDIWNTPRVNRNRQIEYARQLNAYNYYWRMQLGRF